MDVVALIIHCVVSIPLRIFIVIIYDFYSKIRITIDVMTMSQGELTHPC